MREKVIISWSGGKDSAFALYEIQKTGDYEIVALLTTVTEYYDRISMHGVHRILLERQASSLGYPLEKVLISKDCDNEEYESKMRQVLEKYMEAGVSAAVFGDIFLEDVRKYREDKLLKVGMKGIFPLWRRDSAELARTFVNLGFKAIITCVDSKVLDRRFAGRGFDKHLLAELPSTVDPCAENGEFHSFVYDGPIFQEKIKHKIGEVTLRDNRFYFCDLIPV
ncbi:MAG: diphthine--ammonia ligase [Chloroflexi bacterium]|nr:diphthine--ammonia ligase [Chloroflexota bacterium]